MTQEQRNQAVGRIKAKRGFWWHFWIYTGVNTFLVVVWALTWTGYFWPMWSILGWGIGLASHGFAVYGRPRPITEEQIQREVEKGR